VEYKIKFRLKTQRSTIPNVVNSCSINKKNNMKYRNNNKAIKIVGENILLTIKNKAGKPGSVTEKKAKGSFER